MRHVSPNPIKIGTIAKPFLNPGSMSKLENALKYAIPNTANQKIKVARF